MNPLCAKSLCITQGESVFSENVVDANTLETKLTPPVNF